jgi:hypothetical protein
MYIYIYIYTFVLDIESRYKEIDIGHGYNIVKLEMMGVVSSRCWFGLLTNRRPEIR